MAIFLDFDGVLVDIAPRPDAVTLSPAARAALQALRQRASGALAIVSGRTMGDLDRRLSPLRLDVAGLHGAQWRCGDAVDEPQEANALAALVAGLRERVARMRGVLVEDKGASVALHWRAAPEFADVLIELAIEQAQQLGPAFRAQHGKAVVEIVPAAASKGAAIARYLTCGPYAGRIPFFAGDDATDESGFDAVNRCGGCSLLVGDRPTSAKWRVPNATAFRALLQAWSVADVTISD